MASTGTTAKQSAAANPAVAANLAAGAARQPVPAENSATHVGYGLPCAKCRLYYPADLDACPGCHYRERVSPVVPALPLKPAETLPEPIPDSSAVEREREEFLRQFKSQLLEVHAELANAQGSLCVLTEQHDAEELSAEICKACYYRLQERLDACEASLHIDVKEAAQIIYDAVWSDPSDPSKTYENAATALIDELRKRAGMDSPAGPFPPLAD